MVHYRIGRPLVMIPSHTYDEQGECMPQAIRVHQYGGPEVMLWEDLDSRAPGPGEALVRHTAIGLNFIDVYERTGLYGGKLPTGLGHEAAGLVEAVGPGVRGVTVGQRVAYAVTTPGAYAAEAVVPADRLVPVPDDVSDRLAAAALLKGMTAQVLLRRTYRVAKGTVVVVHAAAGGVGSILVQWARHLGAQVIGVVGSESKADAVRALGCRDVLVLGRDDLPARVKELGGGRGAHVVYDSVGKDTFFTSLDCLRPLGLMVTYGNASGPVPPIAPLELARRGSLFLTRPILFSYVTRRAELLRSAKELFDVVGRGVVRIEIGQTYALRDVQQAHRDLQERRTVGSTVLLP
ncbi:MAG TPA: quinone oxidoreductase [Steroidobacteraceae bacterium]|nr:quinone oxidoreductase [Steroidobacteraceae bacterium]